MPVHYPGITKDSVYVSQRPRACLDGLPEKEGHCGPVFVWLLLLLAGWLLSRQECQPSTAVRMPTQVLQAGPKGPEVVCSYSDSTGKAGRVKEATATTFWALALSISLSLGNIPIGKCSSQQPRNGKNGRTCDLVWFRPGADSQCSQL